MKRLTLALMLAALLALLTGCFIQPDPTLEPLTINEGTIPFGTVQSLPTNTPTPVPAATPSPTPNSWSASDQSTWEDWTKDVLPTTTLRTAATAAPDAQSWQTSTQDYNAGYPVLRVLSRLFDDARAVAVASCDSYNPNLVRLTVTSGAMVTENPPAP